MDPQLGKPENDVLRGADDHIDQVVGTPDLHLRIGCVEGSGLNQVSLYGHVEYREMHKLDERMEPASLVAVSKDHPKHEVAGSLFCKFLAFPIGGVGRAEPDAGVGEALKANGADCERGGWFDVRAGRGDDANQYVRPWVQHQAFHLSFAPGEDDSVVIPRIEWTGWFHFIFGWFFGVDQVAEIQQSIGTFLELRRSLLGRTRFAEFFQGEIQQGTSFVITIHDQESTNPERKE